MISLSDGPRAGANRERRQIFGDIDLSHRVARREINLVSRSMIGSISGHCCECGFHPPPNGETRTYETAGNRAYVRT